MKNTVSRVTKTGPAQNCAPAFALFSRVYKGQEFKGTTELSLHLLAERRWITSIIHNFGGKKGMLGYSFVIETPKQNGKYIFWGRKAVGQCSEKHLLRWGKGKGESVLVHVLPYRQSNYTRMESRT